jgi:hypothetical protein
LNSSTSRGRAPTIIGHSSHDPAGQPPQSPFRREDALRGVPPDAERETVIVELQKGV